MKNIILAVILGLTVGCVGTSFAGDVDRSASSGTYGPKWNPQIPQIEVFVDELVTVQGPKTGTNGTRYGSELSLNPEIGAGFSAVVKFLTTVEGPKVGDNGTRFTN